MEIYYCSAKYCPSKVNKKDCPFYHGVIPTHIGFRGKDWAWQSSVRRTSRGVNIDDKARAIAVCKLAKLMGLSRVPTITLYRKGDLNI